MLSIAIGAGQICRDYGDTVVFPLQTDLGSPALARLEPEIRTLARCQCSGTGCAQVEFIGPCSSVRIVQGQRKLCSVSRCQKARQREVDNHWVAYEHGALTVSQAVLAVGDGHEPNLTGEIRNVEADPRQTVGADLHRSRKERHGARAAHRERLATHRGVPSVTSLLDWARISAPIQCT